MKKLLFLLIPLLAVRAAPTEAKWMIFMVREEAVNSVVGYPLEADVISLRNPKGGLVGPLVIWNEPKSGRSLQLSNGISVADLAIRGTTEALTDFQRKSAIRAILANLVRRDQALLFGEGVRDDYLAQMKIKVSVSEAEKISKLLSGSSEIWSEDMWEVSISTVTNQGAIERYTFTGLTKPFSLSKQIVEVMAPIGTVKPFVYLPNYFGK